MAQRLDKTWTGPRSVAQSLRLTARGPDWLAMLWNRGASRVIRVFGSSSLFDLAFCAGALCTLILAKTYCYPHAMIIQIKVERLLIDLAGKYLP